MMRIDNMGIDDNEAVNCEYILTILHACIHDAIKKQVHAKQVKEKEKQMMFLEMNMIILIVSL